MQNFAPEVKEKAAIYVPAIGKVTIAILLRNLLRLAQNQSMSARTSAEDAEADTSAAAAVNGQ